MPRAGREAGVLDQGAGRIGQETPHLFQRVYGAIALFTAVVGSHRCGLPSAPPCAGVLPMPSA